MKNLGPSMRGSCDECKANRLIYLDKGSDPKRWCCVICLANAERARIADKARREGENVQLKRVNAERRRKAKARAAETDGDGEKSKEDKNLIQARLISQPWFAYSATVPLGGRRWFWGPA